MILLLFFYCAFAQKQGNIWYFGDHAGLDFNSGAPVPLTDGQTFFYLPMYGWNEGTSSICDSAGELLFYTNGEKIWNKLQIVMPHGDSLMGFWSSTESCVIVPLPGSEHLFYVFTTDGSEHSFLNGLRYSIVDMCLDNGYGDVVEGAKNILLEDSVAERLIAIKNSNETDYWILTHRFNSDAYYSFRFTSSGIEDTIISHVGTIDTQGWGGQMISSPDGQKLTYVIPNAQLTVGITQLLDFDATTGIVSNPITLSFGGREYGCAFSLDNSKLYFSTVGFGQIFQYDVSSGDSATIVNSKFFILQNGPDSWRDQRLAPDGKIYLARVGKGYLSAINNPNESGATCNYIDSAVYLGGKKSSFGLPNFVTNYDYENTIVSCQTGIEQLASSKNVFSITPNPFQFSTTFSFNQDLKQGTLFIYDLLGKQKLKIENLNGMEFRLDSKNLSAGIYFFEIFENEQLKFYGKLIAQPK